MRCCKLYFKTVETADLLFRRDYFIPGANQTNPNLVIRRQSTGYQLIIHTFEPVHACTISFCPVHRAMAPHFASSVSSFFFFFLSFSFC
jgi:hypothetical protein